MLEGAFSSQWTTQLTGLAEGCPLSPYLAAAVTHCWCELTITRGISGFGYLDDRTILLQQGFSLEVLRNALQKSADFDRACGLACAPDKCFLACRQHSDLTKDIADQFGLQVCDSVDVLGLSVDFNGGWHLLKFSLRKAILRLRLLKWTQTSTFKKQKLVRSLVLPCLHWAAAFATPSRNDLFAVKQEILSLFNPWCGQEAARVLIFERLSWQIEPEYATNLACVREVWRFLSRAPKWTDTCPIDRAFPKWREVFPRAQSVFDKLKWRLNESECRLQRFDANGTVRFFEVGVDSGQRFFSSTVQATSQPSRVHITWCCPCTQDLREGLAMPVDRAQERLFCQPVPTMPPAPRGVDLEDFAESLSQQLSQVLREDRPLYVSTDGGSKDDVGSFAIFFEGFSFGAGAGHEDQSAFRQELNAILFLSRSLKSAASNGARGQVFVICDCQAAIAAVMTQKASATCARLVQEIQQNLQHASILGVPASFIWVPSHNKNPNWRPEGDLDGSFLRQLNERADVYCSEVLSRRLQGSLRQRWHVVAHNAMTM